MTATRIFITGPDGATIEIATPAISKVRLVGPPIPSVADRVAAGARLLDLHVPGWETRLRLPIRKMYALCGLGVDDPLSQLFAKPHDLSDDAYDRGLITLGLVSRDDRPGTYRAAGLHGFDTIWPGGGFGPSATQATDYQLLADAWTNLIEARLTARAGSPTPKVAA